jgi:hypothetical protein
VYTLYVFNGIRFPDQDSADLDILRFINQDTATWIIALETAGLERWGKGAPSGFSGRVEDHPDALVAHGGDQSLNCCELQA